MNVSKSENTNVQPLGCLVEPQDAIDPDGSHYRFLVDGKYVTTAPGTLGGEEVWTFGPILLSELLPPFLPGNWNTGHVAQRIPKQEKLPSSR
jgi:subtilisin family serine protease